MLLKKANTITTPTAYSNGFLHSVKPEVVLGEELVTNGSFDTDSDWIKGAGWTISGGVATNDGTINAIYLPNPIEQGKEYICQIDITFQSAGVAYWRLGNTTNIGVMSLDGTITQTLTGSADGNYIGIFTNTQVTIDNVSVKEKLDADFTFQRNSSATRVNELGYIEDVQIIGGELVSNGDFEEIGSELVTNGSFDTNSNWSFLGTANISGGTANFPDTTNSFLIQTVVPLSVKQYRIQYEVTDTNGGNLKLDGGSSAFGSVTLPNTLGVHNVYLSSNGTKENLQFSNGANFIGSIDNVSVKEVGQDWTFGTGWTMGDGKAVVNGTNTFLEQASTIEQSTLYRVSFTLSDYVSGNFIIAIGGYGVGPYFNANGTYTVDVISNASSNTRIYFYAQNASNFAIDNISVKKITNDTNLPRINYEGFTYAESLGDNLVVNGDFSDGTTDWTPNANATLSIDSGRLKVLVASGAGSAYATQLISGLTIGKTYRVTASAFMGTSLKLSVYSANLGFNDILVDSDISVEFTATATFEHIRLYVYYADSYGFWDNVSVQEVIGNLPVPYSGKGHLLLEGQRTNLVPYSQDINSIPSLAKIGSSITTNNIISPEGLTSVSLLKEDGTNSTHFVFKDWALTNPATYTISVFAKSNGENRNLRLGDGGVGWSSGFAGDFNLTNGTASGGTIENYGNGWYRCSVQGTTNAAASRLLMYSTLGTATTYQGDNVSGVYLYGLQIEEGHITSYIPTNGTAVTRLGETCNNATHSFPSEGVLYAEIAALVNTDSISRRISLSDGTTTNRVTIEFTDNFYPDNTLRTFVFSGATVMDYNQTVSNIKEFVKVAIRYKDNDYSVWIEGVQVHTDTSGTAPTGLIELAFDNGGGVLPFYGKTKMVATFPYLSNDEMECLTGEGYGSFQAMALANNYTII